MLLHNHNPAGSNFSSTLDTSFEFDNLGVRNCAPLKITIRFPERLQLFVFCFHGTNHDYNWSSIHRSV